MNDIDWQVVMAVVVSHLTGKHANVENNDDSVEIEIDGKACLNVTRDFETGGWSVKELN